MSTEGPIQDHLHDQANAIARALDEVFNKGLKGDDRQVGFVLLMFDFSGPKSDRLNYISNTNRADMIQGLKEFTARAEGHITDDEHLT